jgi:hypothetical protein
LFYRGQNSQRSKAEYGKWKALDQKFKEEVPSLRNEVDFLNGFIKTQLLSLKISNQTEEVLNNNYSDLIWDLKPKGKLIFFYQDGVCSSCIFKIYADLAILSEKIGKENILVFSAMNVDPNNMFRTKDYTQVYLETLEMDIEGLNQPFLFVLNDQLRVSHMFVPELFEDLRQDYFTKVVVEYFDD